MLILGRLTETRGTIVVMGDDHHSIHRLRGASVAYLLQFPRWFPAAPWCRSPPTTVLIAAVGRWMDTAPEWDDEGQPFRYGKHIVPKAPDTHPDYPAAISLQGIDARDEARQTGELLRFLRSSGVIAGYDPALLHSVEDAVSNPYPDGPDAVGLPAHREPLATSVTCARRDAGYHQPPRQGQETGRCRGFAEQAGPGHGPCGPQSGGMLRPVPSEQAGRIASLDRVRRRYVACTKARNLLVLTTGGQPQAWFSPIWKGAARWPCVDRDSLARRRFGIAGAATRRVVTHDHLDRLMVSLVQATLVE